MRDFQSQTAAWSTEKSLTRRLRHRLQVEQRQKINRAELPVQRGRTANFRAEREIRAQQFRDRHFLLGEPVQRAIKGRFWFRAKRLFNQVFLPPQLRESTGADRRVL